jgi:hypothetical protein
VIDSLVEATARAKSNRELTLGVMKKYIKSDDDSVLGGMYDYFTQNVEPTLPYAAPSQFSDILAELGKQNSKAANLDMAKYIDSSYVQSAAH